MPKLLTCVCCDRPRQQRTANSPHCKHCSYRCAVSSAASRRVRAINVLTRWLQLRKGYPR
jgi:hypothetical protein